MSEPSGPQWCRRFPGSTSPNDLLPEFRDRVLAFISAMQRGGAAVSVDATYRPPERAYLMHWCWAIAESGFDPNDVPGMAGVAVDWTHHGDLVAARAGARAMVKGYDIQYAPSLISRHTQRRAVDMTIGWQGVLSIIDFNGQTKNISSPPHNGLNPDLIKVGATFGVIKLVSDPPHWSDDGH
jgi:hypothetical protein